VDAKIAAKQKELEEIRIAKEKEAAQEKLYQDGNCKGRWGIENRKIMLLQ